MVLRLLLLLFCGAEMVAFFFLLLVQLRVQGLNPEISENKYWLSCKLYC